MLNHRLIFAISLLLSLIPVTSHSQCCSAGSPVGASTNVGVADKGQLKLNTFYRYSKHDSYFEGENKLDNFGYIDYTFFNYVSLMAGYGLTHKLTIEADAGYFINKTQVFRLPEGYILKGTGLSSSTISLKRAIYYNVTSGFEITGGAGIRLPFSFETKYYNNVMLPAEIQPSTGSFGGVVHLFVSKSWHQNERKLFTYNRFEYNLENKNKYQYGWSVLNSLFYSHKLFRNFISAAELRNETRQFDLRNSLRAVNTGSHVIILSPRLMYSISGKWTISVVYDFPLYRFYSGRQMGILNSFAINISRQFDLKNE